MKILETLLNVGTATMIMLIMMLKSAPRECNINVKLNHTTPVVSHNLKKLWFPSYYAKTIKNSILK